MYIWIKKQIFFLSIFSFVLVNSIALEGDDCFMCSEAAVQLKEVADIVNCHTNKLKKPQFELDKNTDITNSKSENKCKLAPNASIPILLQVSSINQFQF